MKRKRRFSTEPPRRLCSEPGAGDGLDPRFDSKGQPSRVENRKAPDYIVASSSRNSNRTRRLCPYPQVAVYKGTGTTDLAVNFACMARTDQK